MKAFVCRPIPQVAFDRLQPACDVDVWPGPLPPSRHELLSRISGCHGVLTLITERVDAEFFEAAGPQLKVVSNFAVGFNNIDIEEANRRGVHVGNTPGVLTDATADLAVTLLLAAARRLCESAEYARQGHWKTWEPLGHIGQDLTGKTLGIVGMGRIGAAVARRCRGGWGMRVLYLSRQPRPEVESELQARRVRWEELLAQSDFVSVHTDLNESTQGLFNAHAFRQMKPTAVFVNTARGPIHVESDLADALQSGQIFAAGLDVTDPEPPQSQNRLLQLPNCIVAPHIGSATTGSRNGMAEIAADNLLAGMQGQPLRHAVA